MDEEGRGGACPDSPSDAQAARRAGGGSHRWPLTIVDGLAQHRRRLPVLEDGRQRRDPSSPDRLVRAARDLRGRTTCACRGESRPAPPVKAPGAARAWSPWPRRPRTIDEAAELAELEELDREVDAEFAEEFGETTTRTTTRKTRKKLTIWSTVRHGLPLADPLGRPLTTETPEPPRGPRHDMAFLQARDEKSRRSCAAVARAVYGDIVAPGRARRMPDKRSPPAAFGMADRGKEGWSL